MEKYLDSEGVKFLWKDIIKPYINNCTNDFKDGQIIVSDNFEGAENDKGLRHVVRKNKLIAILKNGHVEYAPEGIAFVDAIEPTSFTIGTTTYEVPAGVSYVELGLTTPLIGEALYQKGIYQNSAIRQFGVYLDGSKITSLGLTFSECPNLEWLDLSGLDTSAVTYGFAMMRFNPKLHTIVGKLQFPKVDRIDRTFMDNKALVNVDVSEMGLGLCKEMQSMFNGCSSLAALDVSAWDTAACTNMGAMFNGCSSLTTLDVSGWNTGACTNMNSMFSGCSSLQNLDVSGWNTAACTTMSGMFYGCSSLQNLDVSGWNTAACTTMSGMFYGCSSLQNLDVSGWNTAACKYFFEMFRGCSSLTTLDVSAWDTSSAKGLHHVFYDCFKLESLDLRNWDVSKANTFQMTAHNCQSLREFKTNGFYNDITQNIYCMFENCYLLESIDLTGLNPSNCNRAYGIFNGCRSLTSLRFPLMGALVADNNLNSSISLAQSPLDRASLDSIFRYDRTANGLTNPLTVQLSSTSKSLLTPEEIAAITAKGYTIT